MTRRFSFDGNDKREVSQADFSWLVGNFLVAAPTWAEGPFARTVVLILQHNPDGVFGVIVNRPADADLKKFWMQASGSPASEAERLHVGGPIGGPVFAVHSMENFAEIKIDGGLFISANYDAIHKIIESGDNRYRIFCGMVSWKAASLATELANGLWFPLENRSELIFPSQEVEWERAVVAYGRDCLSKMLGGYPIAGNPELN
ncbi:MAG: YqgE/AlgH family protein [Pirellulaceae bacterium]|nr:YqgE/AlgH family protein [Pirellulaceae bacterium]